VLILAVVASSFAGCSPREVSVEVGSPAPDLSLVGASRDGVLPQPLHLQDFRGRTVVLAFFYKARTPG
jgi:peroxiredoxin